MNTMENINKIVNEDTVNIAAEVVEAIPAKNFNWAKLGKVGAGVGAAVAIGFGIYEGIKYHRAKKQLKDAQEQATATGVDNVQVAKDDFEENDSEE